jgi:hypothetical protein
MYVEFVEFVEFVMFVMFYTIKEAHYNFLKIIECEAPLA